MKHRNFFAYRSFWPEFEAMRKFHEVGIDTITFFPSNSANSLGEPYSKYPSNWLWFDNYDFAPVQKQIEDILAVNPDAELLAMIDLNSPLWLQRQLAGANCDSFTNLSESLANPRWREATTNYVKAITAYLDRNYGDRIAAYIPACGYTDEWMDYSNGAASPEKEAAYQAWRREQALPPTDGVPSRSRREHMSFDNFLRSPETDREALDYWRFTEELTVESICHYSRTIRAIARPGVEIGAFYGYILELTGWRLVKSGHLSYEKLLASEEIDFLISPGTYSHRHIGAGGGFMIPEVTIKSLGKNYMHECDQRTHCFNPNLTDVVKLEFFHWENEAEDIVGLKREMALSLIKHTSLWWFDMWGGYYQSENVFELLRQMRLLWEKYNTDDSPSLAEVALVVDPQSTRYINDGASEERLQQLYIKSRNALNGLGAPFDVLSFHDIGRVADFDRYRLVIMASSFEITPEKRELLERRVLRNNRTVLWLYGAALNDGTRETPTAMRELSGIDFGTPGLAAAEFPTWHSRYLHDHAAVTPALLKKLAAEAGVLLCCDAEQPVFANRRLTAVHTAIGGVQKLRFPANVHAVTELYTRCRYELNQGVLEYTFRTPDLALFESESH